MKKMLVLAIASMFLTACGQYITRVGPAGPQGPVGPQGPAAPTPTVDDVQADINSLVKDENDYRLELGQSIISEGLSCSVQQVSAGSRISSSSDPGLGAVITTTGTSYSYLYKGLFNQPNATGQNNLIPSAIRPLFVGINYYIRCSGYIVVRDTDYYQFEMSSDDGSILTVDNAVVINNDGNHGISTRSGTKLLRRGVRQFKLEYAQTGGGNFAMILKAGGESIDPKHYYH